MAFGTGTHETTRGVMEMLERHWPPTLSGPGASASLLDVGTGTGILSFAAARLTDAAAHSQLSQRFPVVACDLDPDAIRVASENAEINGLQDRIEFHVSSVEKFSGHNFDMVLANLTSDVIIAIAADLCGAVGASGKLIVSGILLDQLSGVLAGLEPHGLRELERKPDGEWVSVVMVR